MTDFELDALARDVDVVCRLTGDFTLRSGQISHEYFDKYRFETAPVLLRRVAERMAVLLPEGTDLLGGLELGGIPLVTRLSSITGIPALFVRKEAKTYGTRRLVEGAAFSGRTVLLVEDVISTGGAVRNAAGALRAGGATVEIVVCAIDRSEPGSGPLAGDGIEIRAVLTRAQMGDVRSTGVTRKGPGRGPGPLQR